MPEEWVSSLPRSSRLEAAVTKGRVVLILEVSFNAMKRSLDLIWTSSPDSLTRDGQISFGSLSEFSLTYSDDFDDDCLADLIGLDEYLDSGFSRFVIHTTEWEMVFASADPPQFSVLGDDRPVVLEP